MLETKLKNESELTANANQKLFDELYDLKGEVFSEDDRSFVRSINKIINIILENDSTNLAAHELAKGLIIALEAKKANYLASQKNSPPEQSIAPDVKYLLQSLFDPSSLPGKKFVLPANQTFESSSALHAAPGIRGLIETAAKLFETSKLTMIDPLMEIYNRRFFDFELPKIMESRQPQALAIIDIDDFKPINDTFGHVTGDKVLRKLAKILKDKIRNSDHLIRYGGEEIAIIFNLSNEKDKATTLAEKLAGIQNLLEIVRGLIESELATALSDEERKNRPVITASIGLTIFNRQTEPNLTLEQLTDRADQAMYASKDAGKNRVTTKLGPNYNLDPQ